MGLGCWNVCLICWALAVDMLYIRMLEVSRALNCFFVAAYVLVEHTPVID